MQIIASEPVEGYAITKTHIRFGNHEKIYDGSDGIINVPFTGENGDWLIFWAESDFGDQSDRIELKFRNFQPSDDEAFYHFDLLGEEWASGLSSGSLIWEIFPPVNPPLPKALEQPIVAGYLHTTNRYLYLAGNLIHTGYVDADSCPGNGLYSNGTANQCGEVLAADIVLEWQNKYDTQILLAAWKHNIPARVLKGIIAQETQFWPYSTGPYELGLGKITANGADMLLMWNIEYFLSTCVPIYGANWCAAGYSNLTEQQKTILRKQILDKVGTSEEIDLLAAVLKASAHQTGQMAYNTVRSDLAEVISYEDMWKISIANYHIGSGCISVGMRNISEAGRVLSWEELINQMVGDCKNAENYVENVLNFAN